MTALPTGARATVAALDPALAPELRGRLADLGFEAGTVVRCVRRAPLGGPTVFQVGEAQLCLRRSLSDGVLVEAPR